MHDFTLVSFKGYLLVLKLRINSVEENMWGGVEGAVQGSKTLAEGGEAECRACISCF